MKARYKYPNKRMVKLNLLQKTGKKELEKKIYAEQYVLEEIDCLCGSSRYEVLAERDRYGIKNRTIICTDCGLIRTSLRMSKESYAKFYSNEYRKIYGDYTNLKKYFVWNSVI